MDTIAERVALGEAIGEEEAREILRTPDLIAVGSLADDVRRRMHGRNTTFLRVLEVHVEAVPANLPQGVEAGEIRIIGRPASADAASDAVARAVQLAGAIPLTGFSLADLSALAGSVAALEGLCAKLRDAGLETIAEAPLDMGDALPEAIAAARRAGLSVTRLTVHDLPAEGQVGLLMRARALQQSLGGVRAVAPLPRSQALAAPTTGYDDVKLVALARLLLTAVPSIQVDWARYGPKLAQVALTVGADDVDGVAAVEGGTLGRRRTALEEIRGNIRAAALEPVERNAHWQVTGT